MERLSHHCEDTSRFTPLYIIRMFLEMRYYRNKHMFFPEVILESAPQIEEGLRQVLKKIDAITDAEPKEIIKHIKKKYLIKFDNIYAFNTALRNVLSGYKTLPRISENLEEFLSYIDFPSVVNHDVMKDLLPIDTNIMEGEYGRSSIFDCIFRYILYLKTKHLGLFNDIWINFKPIALDYNKDEMDESYIFTY